MKEKEAKVVDAQRKFDEQYEITKKALEERDRLERGDTDRMDTVLSRRDRMESWDIACNVDDLGARHFSDACLQSP